jgi:hypothetical protein
MKPIWTVLMIVALCIAAWTISESIGSEAPETVPGAFQEKLAAQMLIDEQIALDKEILKGKHWHTAIFNGVEYTIYTGPGDIAFCRPYRGKVDENTD